MNEVLLTVGEIARRLDQPLHRIRYLIDARGVKPVAKAGHAWVYDQDALQRLGAEFGSEDRRGPE